MSAVPIALAGMPAGHVLSCPECDRTAGPYPSVAEAELLARTHDALHHGGALTAEVSPAGVCESCLARPATRTWHYPAAGAPFALCAGCHPDQPRDKDA